jgi:chaperonin GroES
MRNDSGLTVTADKILICPMKVEEKTAGGIVLPAASQDKEQLAQQMGTVVAMGLLAAQAPEMDGISLGDTVLFPRYRGQDFPVDGVRYWVMRAQDVLGKATKLPDYVLKGAESSADVFGINSGKAA